MSITLANADQASAWDGDEGEYWLAQEERYNAATRRHNRRLLEVAHISGNDRVLDIGCGCGESTRDAARAAVSGFALGVDLSSRMIERARERSRAEGLTNVRFEQADAQVYPFDQQAFDVAISRFGAMFFDDPLAAFRNISRALRPGARLLLLAWRGLERNEWLKDIRGALAAGRTLPEPGAGSPGPFGLADPEAVRHILSEAGFEDVDLAEVNEFVFLGVNPEDAFSFVRGMAITQGILEGVDDATRTRALENLLATLTSHATNEGVTFNSGAWLITAAASEECRSAS